MPSVFQEPKEINHLARMTSCHLWRGDEVGLRMYVGMLDEVVAEHPLFIREIDQPFLDNYLRASKSLKDGKMPTPWVPHEYKDPGILKIRLSESPSEREIVQSFVSDDEAIDVITAGDRNRLINVEARANPGRIDVEIRCGRFAHALEFKEGRAEHDVVGQIQKYMRHLGSFIHYGLYDYVCGWVVAREFERNVELELRQLGVRMMRLHPR